MMKKMSFQVISNIFSDFSFERDGRTDGRTNRASHRGAMAHLKSGANWLSGGKRWTLCLLKGVATRLGMMVWLGCRMKKF